ncbi:uncharacterized protein LOC122502559 isoform X1 [Leptopilina heterotoma]|uniref:uncharacterized protein LOC122502559 isoform X1 n=2 Tax=Leptopilina heterotoma TaxID=63436 RepID=UPI001CAA411B|nr:uncharacterized protein LOC122502559 isoform X1 [Leptopilina heterotoma]XP_043468612.1 uncharacterized protein LOC122502559 isoform X1 [Leptopilina heterotoma]
MIGPTSGTNNVPNREVTENTICNKRKVFDDLDIENFCDEIYQGGRKRYMTEMQTSDSIITQISSDDFSTLTQEEENGSVTRLEVLVVDGNWETSELEHGNHLIDDINQSQVIQTNNGQILTPINLQFSSNQNYNNEVQHFWEPQEIIPQVPLIKPSCSRTNQFSRFQENNNLIEDQENGNLSWLLDFKLDSLIEAADDRSTILSPKDSQFGHRNKVQTNNRFGASTSAYHETKKNYSENSSFFREGNSSFGSNSENKNNSRQNGPKKPPFTYTELIEHALQEKGELTVSAIYQWISEHFPYYKSNDDRWKNSVRHNLSINPHFRKGSKAPHGAGHLWAIANQDELRSRHFVPNGTKSVIETNSINQMITVDEVEAATASISQPREEEAEEIVNSVTLEHCAEQILSGVKREVEVQYLVPMSMTQNEQNSTQNIKPEQKETDFLNPVSKEIVAEECGLIGEGYLVTDLNPAALGLNIVDPDMISPDNLFGEELSFQFYEFTSPSQVQSA